MTPQSAIRDGAGVYGERYADRGLGSRRRYPAYGGGFAAVDFTGGYDGDGGDGLPAFAPDGGEPVGPPPFTAPPYFVAPPPCVRPLIIKVGPGLDHPVKTRIIYGHRPACS